MGVEATDWRAAAANVLDWWRDAGVDTLVDDVPCDWLAAPATVVADTAPSAAAPTPIVVVKAVAAVLASSLQPLDADEIPATLDAFLAWRMGEAVPEASWRGVSIAATGPADARVMVLVDCPDRDDGAAGMLMTGQTGRLFDRMLAAIGLDRASVHLAAVCARRPVAGRIASELDARLTELARHHVALVAPERLLVLGNAASRAIVALDTTPARGSLRPFNHRTGTVEVVASFHPRFLLEKPALKAEAWKDLQMLVGAAK